MIVYDITIPNIPEFRYFSGGKMIRCVYDINGVLSSLVGEHQADGVYLTLSSRLGISSETFKNPIHHHISILSVDATKYAKVFNTKRFVISMHHSFKESLLQKRLPQWHLAGTNNLGNAIMELLL